ncbi:MAG: glycoside hydrolase family 3 C-terminal domain-containing protein, partial [Clostridiales bacterium]|nr:glycoside hydrolase family 3 C-terminal domain-containing protein [Clostridiales bacterium]
AARQSVLLLKTAGVLPLKSKDSSAGIGECAKNEAYAAWGNTSTHTRLAFDAVNDYEIKTVGYAHGYLRGESGRSDLPNTAGILCSEADYALVWLCAESDAYALPDGQIELIDALHRRGIKVIAAVEADGIIDMSFCKKCAAVLYGYRGGQRFADAVYEIVSGKTCPSGRLTEPFPTEIEIKEGGCVSGNGGVLYPFGYGLSYTSFTYSNLKITDAGVTCTVTNTGSCDGYDTVFLYVQRTDAEKGTAKKTLRGYKKVFVKKNDAVKVFIPFDESTFRTYSEKRKKFCIEGGKYGVYLAGNGNDVLLAGEISLEGRVFDERTFTAEKETPKDFDKAYGDFMQMRDATKKAHTHTLPLGAKIAIALMIALYADGLAVLCISTHMLENLGNLRLVIFIGIAAAFDIVALIYIIRLLRLRSVLSPAQTPKKWSDAIGDLGSFREIAKVSYEELTQEESEEEAQGEEEETSAPEEPLSYDNAFAEKGAEDIAYKDDVHFGDLCADFKRFMNARGVEIEMPSVRAIFAALASSNLVLMQIKNKEMLADFMDAMSMYFNDAALMNASNDWASSTDVLWMKANGKYVASPLLDALYSAIANPHKNGMAIINNVSPANLRNYFADFIRFALHPTEEHVLKVNDTTTTTLPCNMRYVLILQEGAIANIPRYLANASVQISPVIGKTSIAGTKPETLSVSRMAFDNLVQQVREEKYLSENVWKRIDALAETVGKSEKFVLGNKNTLRIEKFTSVLLECGADESEALTGAFTSKIVPLLKTLDMYAAEDGESAVFGLIEKIFPDEELSKVRHALVKTAAKEEAQ